MPLDQTTINIVVGIAGALGGFVLTQLWNMIRDLQKQDQKRAEQMAQMQVLVAGSYVRRDEFDRLSNALFQKLDRIEEKVDAKADKHSGALHSNGNGNGK
jgi:hypothetical protein